MTRESWQLPQLREAQAQEILRRRPPLESPAETAARLREFRLERAEAARQAAWEEAERERIAALHCWKRPAVHYASPGRSWSWCGRRVREEVPGVPVNAWPAGCLVKS